MRIPSMPVSYGPCLSHVAMHIFKNMATKFSIPRRTGGTAHRSAASAGTYSKFRYRIRLRPGTGTGTGLRQASARPLGTIIQISPTQAVSATCQGKRVPRSL
eukprot:SAG31_NODE_37365_length_304_cov_221.360976_1_plen_101_part_11